MSSQLVCMCNMVTDDEIEAELKKGAVDTGEIQHQTRAGTSCGRCLVQIDEMVSSYLNSLPEDLQGKLDF